MQYLIFYKKKIAVLISAKIWYQVTNWLCSNWPLFLEVFHSSFWLSCPFPSFVWLEVSWTKMLFLCWRELAKSWPPNPPKRTDRESSRGKTPKRQFGKVHCHSIEKQNRKKELSLSVCSQVYADISNVESN